MVPMARLTWVSGSFSAHVLEARLRSEGIDCELRGAVDGPYVLTVGDMARVDVFVPTDQLADAQFVMLADEVDAALDAPPEGAGEPATAAPVGTRWLAPAVLVLAVVVPIVWHLARA